MLKISHLSVIIDPMVYIIYHKKYRSAIKNVAENISSCRSLSEVDDIATTRCSQTFKSYKPASFNPDDAIKQFKNNRMSESYE